MADCYIRKEQCSHLLSKKSHTTMTSCQLLREPFACCCQCSEFCNAAGQCQAVCHGCERFGCQNLKLTNVAVRGPLIRIMKIMAGRSEVAPASTTKTKSLFPFQSPFLFLDRSHNRKLLLPPLLLFTSSFAIDITFHSYCITTSQHHITTQTSL